MALPRKQVKKPKETPNSKLQKLAQKENFALYILKGRSTHFFKGVLPDNVIQELKDLQEYCIALIKEDQQARNPKRKIKP